MLAIRHAVTRGTFALALATPLVAQQVATGARAPLTPARSETAAAPVAVASRAASPPVIDGRGDDAAWATAQVVDGFRIFDPKEDGDPTFRTVARIAYDDRNLYVLVQAYDPHPDSISALLSRRDERTSSDYIRVSIDSYHDRRTGYSFVLNPAGVQRDILITNDGDEDESWDAVWQGAAAIDSTGWIAEFRIPLSQLRFTDAPEHTFGLMIAREVPRLGERYSWPLYRKSKGGLASQFGELQGLRGLASPRRLEMVPYTVAKNVTRAGDTRAAYRHPMQGAIGADLKVGLSSNLTLDATVNPDFGQVEADPAVLNLSAFETFFEERRPFFLEGTGIFRFDMSCNDGACRGLFYSRRIGRSPQLSGDYGDASTPTFSTILGAAKVTGRLSSGLSIGVLNAVTQREVGTLDRTVEPSTNFGVLRATQELRGGNSGIGLMATSTNRTLDQWTDGALRSAGYSAGTDFWHRFAGNRYQLGGYLAVSQVTGSPTAIARTQRNGVHNFQRPDADLGYDTTRTSLGGYSMMLGLNKRAGGIVRMWTGFGRTSPGFEINDVGFLPRADEQGYSTWIGIRPNNSTAYYRRLSLNVNQWFGWTTSGLPTGSGGNVNFFIEFPFYWGLNGGYGLGNVGETYDDRAARGGPAVRLALERFMWLGISPDMRKPVALGGFMFHSSADEGRSSTWEYGPRLDVRGGSRLSGTITFNVSRRVQDAQWNGNYGVTGSDTTHYTFARLDQTTNSVTTRVNFTATRKLSLQFYAQPFVTKGDFSNWRELAAPRARAYDARFRPFTMKGEPGDFDYKQFRTNSVIRWEYRPGSTIFLVWQQGREQSGRDPGDFAIGRDYRNLFQTYPDNTFLLKASYWFGR